MTGQIQEVYSLANYAFDCPERQCDFLFDWWSSFWQKYTKNQLQPQNALSTIVFDNNSPGYASGRSFYTGEAADELSIEECVQTHVKQAMTLFGLEKSSPQQLTADEKVIWLDFGTKFDSG